MRIDATKDNRRSFDFLRYAPVARNDKFCYLTEGAEPCSGRLKFQDDASTARLEVHGGNAAVVFAQNGGAKAEAKTSGFSRGLGGDEWIEGTGGMEETRTCVGDKNLDGIAFGCGFDADGFLRRRITVLDRFNGELETIQDRLTHLLRVTESSRKRRCDLQPKIDGAMQKFGAMQLLHVAE